MNFTFQQFCKEASEHHSSFTIFNQHSINYQTVQVDFQLNSFNLSQFEPHGFTHIKRPIFWKLPGLGISSMNFVIADVIYFASGAMITFSQGGAAKNQI